MRKAWWVNSTRNCSKTELRRSFFRKVFNNAYEDGVPKSAWLLVKSSCREIVFVKATHQRLPSIYLDLYVGSLEPLYAYLFATQPPSVRLGDWIAFARIRLCSSVSLWDFLILGLVIGMISRSTLLSVCTFTGILAVLASFVLVQLQILSLKPCVIGMGLAFYVDLRSPIKWSERPRPCQAFQHRWKMLTPPFYLKRTVLRVTLMDKQPVSASSSTS